MADTLDRDHMDAALSLLRADSLLRVLPDAEGYVPDVPVLPYVRVYTTIDIPELGAADRIDGNTVTWTTRWYCHCVGANEYSAAAVAGRVRAVLLNVTPAVTGRICHKIRRDGSNPPTKTTSGGITTFDRLDIYRMLSSPA